MIKDLDEVQDGGAGLGAGGEAMVIDQFVFEGASEGRDDSVIGVIVAPKNSEPYYIRH